MSEKIKEILDQLKDSFEYPKFEMPTFDGSDFDYVDNDTLLEPDKCKILLDYINNLQNQLQQKDKEIERLNNIINELEKYINEEYIYDELGMKIFDASELQDKLQELKGSVRSENMEISSN